MASLSFDMGKNAKRRVHAGARRPGMKKPGAVSRPGFTHQTQLWMITKLCKIR
jgi:hypothetical protein